jgi:quinol-cytochrome oxidoreductase complex cytochrome b subunit
VLLNFTGYVLRWDQGIQWALAVGTNLVGTIPVIGDSLFRIVAGSTEVGQSTLTRFYAWHIFGLALPLFAFVGWHIFRVRRDGGIAVSPPAFRSSIARISRFDLVRREVLAMVLTSAALLMFAGVFPAPIAPPITDLSAPASDAGAPWFFLWVQQMLAWGDPFMWGVLVPVGVLVVFGVIPYLFPLPSDSELGRWFPRSNRVARYIALLISAAIIVLTLTATVPK